jgi:antitoxin (DNA-binding transcriptional repressor) of toxin-antitoxin stability system
MTDMNIQNISMTELKKNISEVANTVHFNKTEAIILRHGKPILKLVPYEKHESQKHMSKKTAQLLDSYFGSIPDFPDVVKERRSRKTYVKL